jgi:hypothetical protein
VIELLEWLHAQIDKDEQRSRAADCVPWVLIVGVNASQVLVDPAAIQEDKLRLGHLGHVATVLHAWDAEHMVRHSPERVLRRVEADRLLLDDIEQALRDDPTDEAAQWRAKVMALGYAGEPGYRQEWRP